ncbi:MAG: ferrous iron transport protein A [Bacteroidota bacterium]
MTNPKHDRLVPLFGITPGSWVKITSLPMDIIGARFIRLGITPGSKVKCIERLPGGTIVIQKKRQQIAIGHLLAKQIIVCLLGVNE